MRSYFLNTILFIGLMVSVVTCTNLEDAKPSGRSTYVKFFEFAESAFAADIEPIPGGSFVVLINTTTEFTDSTAQLAQVLEVDANGNLIATRSTIPNFIGKSIKPIIINNQVTNYIVVSDSTSVDPSAEIAANVVTSALRLQVYDNQFSIINDTIIFNNNEIIKPDFFGGPIAANENGDFVVLTSFKGSVQNQVNAPEQQRLIGFNNQTQTFWVKDIPLLDQTFQLSKSIHYYRDTIIWASAVSDIVGNFNTSYVAIPVVEPNTDPINFDRIGENSQQLFVPTDIAQSKFPELGYGIIGTYSETTNGEKGNLFFLRVRPNGNIYPQSDRYFDAIESFKPDSTDIFKNLSSIVDEGSAIGATSDGGFLLAGTFTTTPQKGSGGKDLLLIKVDAFGNMIWRKTLGGTGDEEVTAVLETTNEDLIVFGTNTQGNYSSIFMMRMDKNGELNK